MMPHQGNAPATSTRRLSACERTIAGQRRPIPGRESVYTQDDLAESVAGLDPLLGLHRFGERVFGGDWHLQARLLDSLIQTLELARSCDSVVCNGR